MIYYDSESRASKSTATDCLSGQVRGVPLWILSDQMQIYWDQFVHPTIFMWSFAIYLFLAPYSQAPRGPSLGSCAGWLGKGSGDPKQKSWVQEGSEFAAGLSGCCRVCALRSRVKWAWWAKSCGGAAKADDAGHGLRGGCRAQRLATLRQCGRGDWSHCLRGCPGPKGRSGTAMTA